MAKRKKRNENQYIPSLCQDCMFNIGGQCPSVPITERSWVISYDTEIRTNDVGVKYNIHLVRECERFRRGRIPLSLYRPERAATEEALLNVRGRVI